MLTMKNIPIQVYWRALDLFNQDRPSTILECRAALDSAQSRISVATDFEGITPFAQAVAEYLSLSGPFFEGTGDDDAGEFAGISGYLVE